MITTLTPLILAATDDGTGVDQGPVGFIAIAFVAICVVLLIVDMMRRIRRVRIRDEVAAKLDAEQAAQAAQAQGDK